MQGLLESLAEHILRASSGNPVTLAFILSSIAALLTTAGALLSIPVKPRERDSGGQTGSVIDVGLGFSSGVMIVASFTSLILPAMDLAGFARPAMGFLLGAFTIHAVNKLVPHEHLIKGYEGPRALAGKVRASWLVAAAILIHNLPEGMAIGSASVYSPERGVITGLAIAFQDIPEGLAVALPVALIKGSTLWGMVLGLLSGLSEVLLAVPTAALGSLIVWLLPYLLGFGAGAMVYVVSHEALPESHRTGREREATIGFFAGFMLMLYLDSTLG
ncbi:MAG: ZIP family metal transporter [Desulfurococcales archaeon]|nr:ZIP family metal transporter [Desulfurococcales archaeon]